MHTAGTFLLYFTLQTAIEGLVGSCYLWQMGKLKLGSSAVILKSLKMDFRFIWQNGQKKGCRDISQQPTNADEFDENGRRKVYSSTLENEKGTGEEEYVYPVAL